jgi:plasmid stabilization system protein ParE
MNFSFHPEAEREFNYAIDYYENIQEKLGLEFAQEVFITIQRIIDYPLAWQSMTPQTRRCLTSRFPFGVIYQITEKEIIIIAVMHLNKKPGYWEKRK